LKKKAKLLDQVVVVVVDRVFVPAVRSTVRKQAS